MCGDMHIGALDLRRIGFGLPVCVSLEITVLIYG